MITGKTIIAEILDLNPHSKDILLSEGMHCLGCPSARSERLEEACESHNLDLESLLSRLNNTILPLKP